jgi:hypothetical protein
MDKLTCYRELVRNVLDKRYELHRRTLRDGPVQPDRLFDDANSTYMVTRSGWQDHRHITATDLFVRIVNGKIWIEDDWTMDGITDELLAAGVPPGDIVLGFHPPELRHLTEFAVA